jgi:hypothetical protein
VDPTLQRLLDGELTAEEAEAFLASLDAPARAEALRLQRLARSARALAAPTPPPGFTEAVMARVRARPAPRPSLWTWLRTPRLSPLGAAAAAAAAALLVVALPRPPAGPPASPAAAAPSAAAGVVVTRLSLQAPQARRVAVAGDFNGWSPEAAPLARGPGGAWTGELRLPRGRHQYMFVVDGEWVTDPAAPVTLDDGFGHRNAVLDL